MGEFPVWLPDLSQGALICLVQRLWQLVQSTPDTRWDATADVGQLTLCPTEPTSQK